MKNAPLTRKKAKNIVLLVLQCDIFATFAAEQQQWQGLSAY
jgi:hypothetical protein